MTRLKSALHHWWPRCVSRLWTDAEGKTGWLRPDGTCVRTTPANLGVLRDGHHIMLGDDAGEATAWDFSFEGTFDRADSRFPSVIAWLEGLRRAPHDDDDMRRAFLTQPATDEQLRNLTECVVSLAVRSPMNREASVALADRIGPPKSPRQRNSLIGLNMARSQRIVADSIGAHAKFAVLFSDRREFIFGDGFFHNVLACVNAPHNPKVIAPLTPEMTVIVTRPMAYMVEPRLCTIELTADQVDLCNHAVQTYSRNALFFRSQVPELDEAFRCGQHCRYARSDNPMDQLIQTLPGISSAFPGSPYP